MPTYSSGDRVTQSQYGHGTVSSVNEYHTKVDFDDHGLRTFASSLVVLTPSQTPAPERKKPAPRRKRVAAAAASSA